MDLEDRVDNIDDKLDALCIAVARIETKMEERSKLWGKSTIKLLAAVAIAVLSALGINAACTEKPSEIYCVDAGVDAGDGGDNE